MRVQSSAWPQSIVDFLWCLDVILASPASQLSSREKQEERASSSSSLSSVTLFSPCLSGSSSARPGNRGQSQALAGAGSACPSWYRGPKRGTRANISYNTQFGLVSVTARRRLMSLRQLLTLLHPVLSNIINTSALNRWSI